MLNKPRNIPSRPGVYFFQDQRGKNLYIGKAANLKSRLSSYWQKPMTDPRLQVMLEKAARVIWQETGSPIEALILESQLIKKNRPAFNILLRDGKQYFYVVLTKETFPKVLVTHQIYKFGLGPFTDGGALRTTLRHLRRIFPYCTCKQKHLNLCLNYHLGNCIGYCCLKNSSFSHDRERMMNYQKNTKAIKEILSGKKNALLQKLEKEMSQAAENQNFEKAVELRNKIKKLKKVFANVTVIKELAGRQSTLKFLQKIFNLTTLPRRIEAYDVANIQGQFATGAMAVFSDGQPDKNEYRKFKIRLTDKPDDTAMFKEVLTRRFNHLEWPYPDLILVDGGKAQLNAVLSIAQEHHLSIPIIALTKNERHRGEKVLVNVIARPTPLKDLPLTVNQLLIHLDDEAHRFAIGYHRQLHRRVLAL